MWAIVIVMLHALSGPQARAITEPAGEQHVFATEAECQARIKEAVPAKLGEKSAKEFAEGTRRYVCVRISNADMLQAK